MFNLGAGTVGYAAPEALAFTETAPNLRVPYDDEKADVWSLGVLLLTMKYGVQFQVQGFYPPTIYPAPDDRSRLFRTLRDAQQAQQNGVRAVAMIDAQGGLGAWQHVMQNNFGGYALWGVPESLCFGGQ